ncbi:ABC transporter permease [Amaricoccus solimangrovi]|uniref:FtsX-like permease family protein n=1 Tax=Amaricoccus solimangrovi TaxID=2589815 RepID=A0A501WHQ0_9RHOB|nr:FtsX-like permease family protein [Amaricoccus solimangrovi]TPE48312.1 FtsX-like permease family protein [Amaricoccus solimangrovi]
MIPVAWRLATRELRGGLRGFYILLICLTLGVAAIAAVGTVRSAIEHGLEREAAAMLGGDAKMEFAYRFATGEERGWMDRHAAVVSEIVDFRSMVATGAGDARRTGLVQVKGIDDAYPLIGAVTLAGGGTLRDALATRDGLPGMVAQGLLLDRLGLRPGDVVTLGTQRFRIADRIVTEPDGAGAGFTLGPRVIVRRADLAGSGLLGEGSLFDSEYRLRLAPGTDLDQLRDAARAAFADAGLQWRDRRDATPSLRRFVDRLGSFLVLMGLAGLAVGGVGVGAAVRGHLDGKKETIATLRTLGAESNTVLLVYLIQIGLVATLGIALGLALGAGLPLAAAPLIESRLPMPAAFGLYARPLVEAAVYGGLTALIFTLWPLARARDIRAAELFREIETRRRWPAPVFLAAILALVALLIALAVRLSGDTRLALTTVGGLVFALALLLAAALGLRLAARRAARSRLSGGRPALRWALAALGGPSGETAAVVLSLGLGLAVLAGIGQIDYNMRHLVAAELPDRAPAFFFVDIQDDQLARFVSAAESEPGVERVETAPMLRGVITRINGVPAREAVGHGHWALSGDRGVTYAAAPPPGTTITQGEWWPADYAGEPRMSFAEEEAGELGLRLGDKVTLNVLGRDLTATITSLRRVDFRSMGINFLMILNPAALAGAPHGNIATVYAGPEAEAPLLRAVTADAPNITAISVREAMDQASDALRSISAATRWGAGATLLTGIIVLIGAAASGQRARVYESAVLRTLGATRARVLASFALRSALAGLAAGVVAVIAGLGAGWWVTARVMEADYVFAPGSALFVVAGGALASLVAGLVFALRPLRARPARVLRARE